MSGMYNLIMGDGHEADRGAILLGLLGNPPVARYRDAWVEKGNDGLPVIAIYTRQGGGNRQCYCEDEFYSGSHPDPASSCGSNEILQAHDLYIRDEDDDFDCTYATFYFRVPVEAAGILAEIAQEPVNMSDLWQQAIEAIRP